MHGILFREPAVGDVPRHLTVVIRQMNIFELSSIASPISGLLAGMIAASGHGGGIVGASSTVGLLLGAAAYFVPALAAGWCMSRIRKPGQLTGIPDVLEKWVGFAIVLYAMVTPFLAWWIVSLFVARLLGVNG